MYLLLLLLLIGGEREKSRPCWILLASDWWREELEMKNWK